jgi:hypothetical protein
VFLHSPFILAFYTGVIHDFSGMDSRYFTFTFGRHSLGYAPGKFRIQDQNAIMEKNDFSVLATHT